MYWRTGFSMSSGSTRPRMIATGYPAISLEEIKSFRELGSHCMGHPEFDPAVGIEVTTGPLGQGSANAFGMALAEAYLSARFGKGLVDHHTYAFVGDGCLQEGIGQEMISLAGHLRLSKLILFWDDNKITDDGATSLSISEDVAARFRVADWHVVEVDGHDLEAVSAAIAQAKADPRPSLIACRTLIGRGIPRVQGLRGGHSARLYDEDAQAARKLLDWPHAPFEIPAPVLAGWREVLLGYKRRAAEAGEAQGGINISGEINDLLVDVLPERMVGCADLEAPTSHKRRLQAFTAEDRSGAYVHCGVREHLMGAMANMGAKPRAGPTHGARRLAPTTRRKRRSPDRAARRRESTGSGSRQPGGAQDRAASRTSCDRPRRCGRRSLA